MNRYYCSDGTRITETGIQSRYKRSRQSRYAGIFASMRCEGCGSAECNGSAHIIAKARCKYIHKTELIWDQRNYFPACPSCNRAIENPKGDDWKHLKNIYECLEFIFKHDPELYRVFEANAGTFEMPKFAQN